MMKPETSQKIERAFDFTVEETRDAGDGLTLEGYAAVFNSPTEINSWEGQFTETIAPGAFKRSIGDKMPVMQFDHGHHPMIGGLPIGVIRSLTEDTRGLRVKARLSDNWLIQPIRDAIRDGAITGMSFRFTVRDEEWSQGETVRTIKAVDLHELGPVTFPAYAATSVGVRSSSDPVFQLVELLRSDESLRAPLAAALAFGASAELAVDDGASPDLADDEPAREEPQTSEQPNGRRDELLELADYIERAALSRERSRLI
jgi:uncharacterized protein